LRPQRAVEQMVQRFLLRRGFGRLVPAEMAVRQFKGLQDAGALADGQRAAVKRQPQRALRRFAARPGVVFLDRFAVVDIAQ
jgi:hypothetical protein